MLIPSLFILDTIALCALCHYVGFTLTILVWVPLSLTGLLLSFATFQRLLQTKGQCMQGTPFERELLEIYEARGTFVLALLFIWPGFFSTVAGLLMVLPKFRADYYQKLLRSLTEKAHYTGKTLEQLVKESKK